MLNTEARILCRLHDIIHTGARKSSEPQRLTLVFEYAEQDLKDYMTSHRHLLLREPFLTKVCNIVTHILDMEASKASS